MRPSRDAWAMALVEETARRSTCLRRSVGCVLLDARGHVLATGYNGVHAGAPHCNESLHACPGARAESGTRLDECHAVHAEQNALLQCRDVYAIDAAYISVTPCVTCAKLLLNTSCRRIVFDATYSGHEAVSRLWGDRIWEGFGGG